MVARNQRCLGAALALTALFTVMTCCTQALALGQREGPPLKFGFGDFRVKPVEIEENAPLLTPPGQDYAEIRERYQNSAINFAGRYVIVRISCGAGCETGWIVNALTGRMYGLPTVFCLPEPDWRNFQKLEFRPDSALLVLTGILNVDQRRNDGDVKARRYYYRFDGTKLVLIDSEPIQVR